MGVSGHGGGQETQTAFIPACEVCRLPKLRGSSVNKVKNCSGMFSYVSICTTLYRNRLLFPVYVKQKESDTNLIKRSKT